MFQSLRHKIILVAAVCASITLLGFVALYWLTLEQHQSLDRHRDLPAVSLKWFSLNNAVHKASLAQKAWIDSGDLKFIKERDLTWAVDIHPAFKQLDLLYKKVRVWEGERSVERRVFYDLRLMILSLENLQKDTSDPKQKLTLEEAQIIWTNKESPLVQNISSQVEIMIRWQTNFARQQESKLRQGLSGLGIWIWVVASVVLLLVWDWQFFLQTESLPHLENYGVRLSSLSVISSTSLLKNPLKSRAKQMNFRKIWMKFKR